jgi:tetratricopeptide (TPR) repeat protein
MRITIGIGMLAFAVVCCSAGPAPGGDAAASALWGDLEPGRHAVGFMAFEKYDYSRSFEAKKDYYGSPLPGERGRPVQVCVWYPAIADDADPRMVHAEYAFIYPGDSRFFGFLGNLQDREVGVLHYIFNNDRGAVIDLQSEELAAVRDAPAAPGRFPLILYSPHFNISADENVILCEYLASHGFVVAGTHAYGPAGLRSGETPMDVEVLVDDLGFVLAAMHEFDFIDHDRLGVLGSGGGGVAALLFQMGNLYVDAVAGLNARFLYSEYRDLAEASARYDIRRASVPMMHICGGGREGFDPSLVDSLEYADRYALIFSEMSTLVFSSYRMFLSTVFAPNEADSKAYEATCSYLLNFFEAYLNGSEGGRTFLGARPEANGLDFAEVVYSHVPGRELPPTPEQFMAIFQERGVDEAVAIFEKFRAENPGLVLFEEANCNYAGYSLLQQGQAEAAVAVFRMNTEAYPNSANTWDSLAEAYLATGDEDGAAECYRMVLEVLPDDPAATDELRGVLRSNAEQFLERPEE